MVQSSALMHMPSISLHLNNARPASEEEQLPVLERSWHRAPNGAGAGLVNMGNTCYMNSVLQCLAHLPPLANIVHAQSHSRSCSHYQQGSTCICCLVENQLWQQLYYGNRSPFKPDKFYDGLLQLRRGFQRWRQEDAHELLRCLTDAMEGCLLRQSLGYNPQRPPRCPKTWVNLMFSGILQSQVRCLRCGYVSNTYDPFMDLSLELHNSCRQLSHCLQHFTAAETLDGKNSYRCDGCKQLVPARKQITVWDDPNILVVHLKRFHDFSGQKISQPISFAMSLDLESFMCPTRALHQQQQPQQQQHSLLGPARPPQQQQQQQRPGVAVFNGSGYTRVGGGGGGGVRPAWGAGDQQRQQQQQQEKLLMHQQHQQHQQLLHKKAAGQQQQQQQQHPWQQQDGACANGSSSSNRSSPGMYDLHGVLVHKGFTANSGHYYSYVRGGNPANQWFCANDSSVYRVQGPAEVMGQTRDAYMLFYVRRGMKQQAELPVQPEPAAAAAAAAAPAAVAAGAAGRLKRALSSVEGTGSPDSCSTRVFVGPQLPPHLQQKRQRVTEHPQQQQQQEEEDVDMFAEEEEPSAAAAVTAAIGPQLPSDWRPSAAAKAAAAAIGPQLPPGWKPSAAAASGNGSSSESTAAAVVQAAAILLPDDAAAEPSMQLTTAATAAGTLSPAAAAATAAEARAAAAAAGAGDRHAGGVDRSSGSSLLQQAAATPLPAAAAAPMGSGDGFGGGALAGLLAGYGDDDEEDENEDNTMAAVQTQPPPQQHPQQQPAVSHQQHPASQQQQQQQQAPVPQQQQQPAKEHGPERGSNAGSAAMSRRRRSSSAGGAATTADAVVTPVMLKSELWDALAERKTAFKPTLVAELEKARDEGTPLPQVKPVLLTLFRGSAAVKEAAESVLSHAVKIAQSALSACL